ncbi:class I SAM-dependent methyltransferase [Rhizobium rhizophilum]|uniref:Class I SAM-dependent methyltransferase n=1 Tax=Rhizobium rhizophilum TaxID=1850373 RepID=A0ABY2QN45_9HYPH|nr:class I SAM-dependent methyltransferase [Rhizobium rhizophilum]THV10585.1 class I SAM-dependent methyltransferase [Rhizobium rhizophilum]
MVNGRRILSKLKSAISGASMIPSLDVRLKRIEKILSAPPKGAASKPTQLPLPPMRLFSIEKQLVPCPICGAGEVKWASAYPSNEPMFRRAITLFCGECGSGYAPDADDLISDFYRADYARSNRKDREIPPEQYFLGEPTPKLKGYFSRAKQQADALARAGAHFGNVLDYGSGPGYFLYISGAEQKFAVELDQESRKYLDYIGAEQLHADSLPVAAFDVIVASHVVEHFTASTLSPLLGSMLAALKDTGLLLIEVPNGGHTYINLTARQDPHTLFFTPQGLRSAVQNAGGKIVKEYFRGEPEGGPPAHQVYFPDRSDTFASTRHGGLTIIAKK